MKIFTKVIFIVLIISFQSIYAQWIQTTLNKSGKCFCSVDNNIFTGGEHGIIYKTTDYGNSWIGVDIKTSIYCITKNTASQNLYAGTAKGLRKSTNNGSAWDSVGFGDKQIYTIVAVGNLIMFGTDLGIYKSTNNGANWELKSLGNKKVNSICFNYTDRFYAGTTAGIYESIDSGATWGNPFQIGHNINVIAYVGSMIIAGSNQGYLFYNSSGGWTPRNTDAVYSITSGNGTSCLMGKANGKITRYILDINSPQNVIDSTATDKSQGLPSGYPVTAILKGSFVSNYIYAGFSNMGPSNNVWRTSYNYVDVKKISSEVPSTYDLKQNYPNPFNPSTTIRYQLPKEATITLKIYDITGKELETLVNEKQTQGTYEVSWNAEKYSSGVYFYKIESEGYTDTKRMLLVK